MRLLKRERSGWFGRTYSFRLIEYHPNEIPAQYAILSHRWGPEEVTFEDLKNGTAQTKAGYRKLEFCGEQADRDGLVYFWIDTCCIDKKNNTELSEAINSMFKWYKNATECYVYLPDVSINGNINDQSPNEWESAFKKSIWFTRGWTLQELIAPKSVQFFSQDGKLLGDKRLLEQQIHQITRITIEALQGKPLAQFSIPDRLSWTERRETTVEEDAAYCLLGIFDIHMPLLYGEGRKKAMARLQREIQISFEPVSVVSTDHETQLARLEEKIFAKDHTSKIASVGRGGVEKTQLVQQKQSTYIQGFIYICRTSALI
jgi:Heterokaryon incompatibility protein (HET)